MAGVPLCARVDCGNCVCEETMLYSFRYLSARTQGGRWPALPPAAGASSSERAAIPQAALLLLT
jgi:hypothetical protein